MQSRKVDGGKKDAAAFSITEKHPQTPQVSLNATVMDLWQIKSINERKKIVESLGKESNGVFEVSVKTDTSNITSKIKLIQVLYKQHFTVLHHYSKRNMLENYRYGTV